MSYASAAPIVWDLTAETTCTIGDGIFSVYGVHPAGTGEFDERKDPNFTRDLQLTEIGTTMIGRIP